MTLTHFGFWAAATCSTLFTHVALALVSTWETALTSIMSLKTLTLPLDRLPKLLSEFNSKVWNEKKQKELSLKDSIKIDVPETLNQFKKDLIAMHNLESN